MLLIDSPHRLLNNNVRDYVLHYLIVTRAIKCIINKLYLAINLLLYITSLRLGADNFTDLHSYLDNGVPNCHQLWHGDSLYPYLCVCKKYKL